MDALLNWLFSLTDTINSLISYVIGLLQDLVKMVVFLGQAAVELPKILAFLPSPVVLILVSFLAGAILYKVLGREG